MSSKRYYSPVKGMIFLLIGWFLIFLTLSIYFFMYGLSSYNGHGNPYPGCCGAFLLACISTPGVWFIRYGKKLRVPPIDLVLKQDTRAPIVYLRSFLFDGCLSQDDSREYAASFGISLPYASEEEKITKCFFEIGPVIAIGNPKEALPELGAIRLYVSHDDWKTVVTDLIQRARFVILRIGTTKGLVWEIDNVIKNCAPEVVLLFNPSVGDVKKKGKKNHKPDLYEDFRQLVNSKFPHPLPEEMGGARFIFFNENWVPECSSLPKNDAFRTFQRSAEIYRVQRELKIFFERANVPVLSLPTVFERVIGFIILVFIGIGIFFVLCLTFLAISFMGFQKSEMSKDVNHGNKVIIEPKFLISELKNQYDTLLKNYFTGIDKHFINEINFLASNDIQKWRSAAENFIEEGMVLYGICLLDGIVVKKDTREAFKWFDIAAQKNNPVALEKLGECLLYGKGIDLDKLKGLSFYFAAAEANNPVAMNKLAFCYSNGFYGLEKNEERAFYWSLKSSNLGNTKGMVNQASCLILGRGTPKNTAKAFRLFEKASGLGYEEGAVGLGVCFKSGFGVKKNDGEAFRHFKIAAEHGSKMGMFELGLCFKNGYGVQKDDKAAIIWFKDSAQLGYEPAKKQLKELGVSQ